MKKTCPKAIPKRDSVTRGAPTLFKKEYSNQGESLALLGATDNDLAKFFDVNVDTIYEWKKKHREFSEALRRGKTAADIQVAKALFRRAVGYKYTETLVEEISHCPGCKITKKSNPLRKRVIYKELPPDVGAATMWLKNRQPSKWRDRNDINHLIEHLPDEQLQYIIDFMQRKYGSARKD